jgi:preprotein translocase subunit SecD
MLTVSCSWAQELDLSRTQELDLSTNSLPQFLITRTDVASVSVEIVTGRLLYAPTQETAVLHFELVESKAKEFRAFSKKNAGKKTQLLADGKVILEAVMLQEISGKKFDVTCGTTQHAKEIAESLRSR